MMFRIPILFGAVWVVCIVGARAQDRHAIAVSGQQRALVEFRGDTMEVMILSENQTDTQAVVLGEMVATAQVEAADYNGDGYADFSVQFLGDRYHTPHRWRIFLFQPSAGRFREVPLPEGNGHVGRPTGFLNPYFLEEEGILFVQADYTRVLQDQRERRRAKSTWLSRSAPSDGMLPGQHSCRSLRCIPSSTGQGIRCTVGRYTCFRRQTTWSRSSCRWSRSGCTCTMPHNPNAGRRCTWLRATITKCWTMWKKAG